MRELTIKLTTEEINTILKVLQEHSMPMVVSAPVFKKIQDQANVQLMTKPVGEEGKK